MQETTPNSPHSTGVGQARVPRQLLQCGPFLLWSNHNINYDAAMSTMYYLLHITCGYYYAIMTKSRAFSRPTLKDDRGIR